MWATTHRQCIHIDYGGMFQNSMFLVVVDAHSKWLEGIPASSATSSLTIKVLCALFTRFGIQYHTIQLRKVKQVQTFKQALHSMYQRSKLVKDKLAKFLTAYRNSPHSTTCVSPAQLLIGRPLHTHLDWVKPNLNRKMVN